MLLNIHICVTAEFSDKIEVKNDWISLKTYISSVVFTCSSFKPKLLVNFIASNRELNQLSLLSLHHKIYTNKITLILVSHPQKILIIDIVAEGHYLSLSDEESYIITFVIKLI